jgi:type VI secretion system secreted protein VgrG
MGIMVLPTQAYSLRISKQPAAFSVLSFEGQEDISKPYWLVIEFTCARAGLPIADVLGKRAKFSIEPVDPNAGLLAELAARLVKPPERLVSGIVTEFDELSSSADETRYRVKLEARLADLGSEVASRLFQNQTVPAVIESSLRHYGYTAVDFKFQLRAEYETHEYITQYAESALAFIQRIAAEEGIWFRFEQTPEHEVIVFGDDLDAYARDPKLSAPYREEGGFASRGADSVMTLVERRKRVVQSITVDDYNHRTAGVALLTKVNTARDDETTVGNQYRWGEHYTTPEAGKRVATLRHQAELAQQVIFEGTGNVIGMTPGAVFRFTNRELENAEHGLMITRVKHKASRKEAYTCEFTAIPSDRIYRSMVDPAAKPRITGILPARVMSPDNYKYAYMTPQSGYRIKSPFDLDEWSPGGTSRPVRLAKPYAGSDYGHHFPLIDGTEVAVIFTDGDPNRPIIIGAMHDSQNQDHVNNENNTRNILRTAGGNEMQMEDREGTEHTHLKTLFQATQLNLGHLVNDQREKRGLGGELRSDEHVALRGGMGVLISAEAQPNAVGKQLDMQNASDTLTQALEIMSTLNDSAAAAKAWVAEIDAQRTLLEQKLSQLQAPVVLASAPQGIALASGQHVQVSAKKHVFVTAGDGLDIGVLKRITAAAGDAISLFAARLGIKIFAAKGKIQIQAQGDEMEIQSLKDLSISSSNGEVKITALKGITLGDGSGAYLKVANGKIELVSTSEVDVKGGLNVDGPGGGSFAFPSWDGVPVQVIKDRMKSGFSI